MAIYYQEVALTSSSSPPLAWLLFRSSIQNIIEGIFHVNWLSNSVIINIFILATFIIYSVLSCRQIFLRLRASSLFFPKLTKFHFFLVEKTSSSEDMCRLLLLLAQPCRLFEIMGMLYQLTTRPVNGLIAILLNPLTIRPRRAKLSGRARGESAPPPVLTSFFISTWRIPISYSHKKKYKTLS